ncbi:MAG: MFS transporter [Sphingomonas fennica]
MTMATRFDIQAVIDRQKALGPQLPLLVLMTIVMLIDGYDVFMLGRVGPAIAADFGEPITALTLVVVFQQIGLAVGSFAIGPLSDRYGRKTMLLASVAAFGVLTLATLWARSLTEVAILRGIAGLFLAGVIPNATALLTEHAPPSRRASFVSIAFTGYTGGGMAAAGVAILLLDDYGWESAFWIGGLVPLALLPLFFFGIRESLQFRAARNPADPRIARGLMKIEPGLSLSGEEVFVVGEGTAPRRQGPSVGQVFGEGRLKLTLLLWAAYFIALGLIALLAAWMSALFLQLEGVPLSRSAAYALLSFLGGVCGTTTVGALMDRLGRTKVLVALFTVDALALMGLGLFPFGSWPFTILMLIWGYAQAGGQGGINALCAQVYPTTVRSTGVGWAFGVGRLGGVVLPAAGGLLLVGSMSIAQAFFLIGLLPLAVAACLFAIGRLEKAA